LIKKEWKEKASVNFLDLVAGQLLLRLLHGRAL
jgi:hypothetical protein